MTQIIPAIMSQNFEDLKEKYARVRGLVSAIQIDIMDGQFTPQVGWPSLLKPDIPQLKPIKTITRMPQKR